MISLLLTSLLAVGFSADLPVEADVPVVVGKYIFKGQFDVLRKTEAYTIPVDAPEGEDLVNRLLGEGYRCSTQTDDSFLCWKESSQDLRDSLEVSELVAERCKAESMDFRAVYDPTEFLHNSNFLRSFKVYQKVIRFSPQDEQEIVSVILYSWNTTGRWWITFPGSAATSTYDLMMPEAQSLKRLLTVEKNDTENKIKLKRTYQVQVEFTRE